MATIPIATVVRVDPIPVDAQELVTNPVVVIAGTLAGQKPFSQVAREFADDADTAGTPHQIVPWPVVHENPDALDATYHASQALEWPPGSEPFLDAADLPSEPTISGGMSNAGDPSAARDGDATTYAGIANLSAGGGRLVYNDPPIENTDLFYGFQLTYSLEIPSGTRSTYVTGTPANAGLILSSRDPYHGAIGAHAGNHVNYPAFEARYVYAIPETDGTPKSIYALGTFDARAHADNAGGVAPYLYAHLYLEVLQQGAGGALQVFDFHPLMVNAALADSVVSRNVQVPALAPQRVTVRGYVAADAEHTITGWPGGDFTGAVAQHTYQQGLTIIDFEQRGPASLADADRLQDAIAKRRSARRRIDDAFWPVLLGERQ